MRACILAIALGACSFSRTGSVNDAPVVPDAGMCAGPSQECQADGVTLRTCAGEGAMSADVTCAWGCVSGEPHKCGSVRPTGGGAQGTDVFADPALADIMLSGTIDGNTGAISGSVQRNPVPDVAGIGYELRMNANGTFAIFRFKSLTVNGVVNLRGTVPIILIANGPIIIENEIGTQGAPACTDNAPGPGGLAGGDRETTAAGSGGGVGQNVNDLGGGGGGAGGDGGLGAPGSTGGLAFGDTAVTILVGGGGGGGGGGGSNAGFGGGGGGAVQLISNTSIEIRGAGGINVGGCGGDSGNGGNDAGGGGGAGGTIVLEAPTITIDGGKLAANGGAGAANGNGAADGQDGQLSGMRATGGSPAAGGKGGDGAAGTDLDGQQGEGAGGAPIGGGGGAIGRIRLNTRTGDVVLMNSPLLSPTLGTDTNARCTAAPANVK
jgi:hypothetical protein